MKRLSIMRHAKSSRDDSGVNDFYRPLTDSGWEAAIQLGSELKHRSTQIDRVLASPSARVRETIDAVRQEFDFDAPVDFE